MTGTLPPPEPDLKPANPFCCPTCGADLSSIVAYACAPEREDERHDDGDVVMCIGWRVVGGTPIMCGELCEIAEKCSRLQLLDPSTLTPEQQQVLFGARSYVEQVQRESDAKKGEEPS